jgi:hypothetical protein
VADYIRTIKPAKDYWVGGVGVTEMWVAFDLDPPPQLGLIAGDAIHNLRAALDNLMWEVAPLAIQTREPDRLVFPIKQTRDAFEHYRNTVLEGFDAVLVEAIRRAQPFVPSEHGGLPDGGGQRLALLHTLWNDDKHRVPTVSAGFAGGKVPTSFHGSATALRRIGTEVRFYTQRTHRHATLGDLDRVHALIVNNVVPSIRAVVRS